jgi:hypothetical protein
MGPRGRGKEVTSPAPDFRPAVDCHSGLHEGGQRGQPVDPTPDINACLRRLHHPKISKRAQCPLTIAAGSVGIERSSDPAEWRRGWVITSPERLGDRELASVYERAPPRTLSERVSYGRALWCRRVILRSSLLAHEPPAAPSKRPRRGLLPRGLRIRNASCHARHPWRQWI